MVGLWALACTAPAPAPPAGDSGPVDVVEDTAPDSAGDTAPADSAAPDPCAPSLEIGSGVESHLPLSEGDAVTVEFGPQGGWHVDVSGRVVGTGQVVGIHPTLTLTRDGLLLSGELPPETRALVPDGACAWTFWGVRAYLGAALPADPAPFVCDLDGEAAELAVTVEDLATGLVLEDRIAVVLARDPDQDCP
jgi:hypothetical protein